MARLNDGRVVLDIDGREGAKAHLEIPLGWLVDFGPAKLVDGGLRMESWTHTEALAFVRDVARFLAREPAGQERTNAAMVDALDAIWFRVPQSETRPDRAWNRDDPTEVMRAVREWKAPVANSLLDVAEKRRLALHAIWTMIRGEGADWTDPEQVVNEVANLVGTNDDLGARPAGVHVCGECPDAGCLHDHGCAHGCQANDVPAATEREIKRFIPPMQVISLAVVDKVVNPDTAIKPGQFTPSGPETDYSVHVPIDLAEADPFAGVDEGPVSPSPGTVERTVAFFDEHSGELATNDVPCTDCGARECPDDDLCYEVKAQASKVASTLGDKAREVVRFLADRDPQTSLRILGAVFGGEDLDGEAGAESRAMWPEVGAEDRALVVKVDPLEHDAGKPLMGRWTLTPLGREVARILARG